VGGWCGAAPALGARKKRVTWPPPGTPLPLGAVGLRGRSPTPPPPTQHHGAYNLLQAGTAAHLGRHASKGRGNKGQGGNGSGHTHRKGRKGHGREFAAAGWLVLKISPGLFVCTAAPAT
jgi:hypothetical protein